MLRLQELTSKEQVGAILGEGGRKLSAIRERCRVGIELEAADKSPGKSPASSIHRRLVITGTETECFAARSMVHDALRAQTGRLDTPETPRAEAGGSDGGGSVRLTIPRNLVGRVIGKRGSTINALRERTGAVIEVTKDDHGVGTVALSGSPTAVRDAREEIEDITAEELPVSAPQALAGSMEEVLVLRVPARRVGKVIGSSGAVIQSIRQQTGASIGLQKEADGTGTCTLRGQMEAMRAAKSLIERIIDGEQ